MERYEADANGALAELYAFIIQVRKSHTRSRSRCRASVRRASHPAARLGCVAVACASHALRPAVAYANCALTRAPLLRFSVLRRQREA